MSRSENKRALSVSSVLTTKRKLLEFDGRFLEAIGNPEVRGSWIIYGVSGSGKTSFCMQLAKYLTNFGRVAYNSLEEGNSQSIRMAFERVKMHEVGGKLILLDGEPIEELKQRLRRQRAPRFVFIDSIQYSGLSYDQYRELINEFKNTLFILISHAERKQPSGAVAKSIKFDAFVKIRVEGYIAYPMSRYGGGSPYIVWDQKAHDYYPFQNTKTA
ncbi:MAG: AAA family ATPase [Flavobacteriales bacterium]|nr:AAA family ATPase [Flavobacteriales bacterium]